MVQAGASLFTSDLIANNANSADAIYDILYKGKNKMPGYGIDCKPRVRGRMWCQVVGVGVNVSISVSVGVGEGMCSRGEVVVLVVNGDGVGLGVDGVCEGRCGGAGVVVGVRNGWGWEGVYVQARVKV